MSLSVRSGNGGGHANGPSIVFVVDKKLNEEFALTIRTLQAV
jgi:hypothetical protein